MNVAAAHHAANAIKRHAVKDAGRRWIDGNIGVNDGNLLEIACGFGNQALLPGWMARPSVERLGDHDKIAAAFASIGGPVGLAVSLPVRQALVANRDSY